MEVMRSQLKAKTPQPHEMQILTAARMEDLPEIQRTAKGIIKVLKKFGGYEPEVDDIWVYRIADCIFYLNKSEYFLDAQPLTNTPTHESSTYRQRNRT